MPGGSFFNKYSLDPDAKAFIIAAGITNVIEKIAVNYLVTNLKLKNLWNLFIALYPFVGGTASAHKWNLKNLIDADAAFRLVFTGGVTHNSNGVTFDGVNGYADTFLTPSVSLTFNDESMFLYSRNQRAAGTGIDFGSAVSVSVRDEFFLRSGAGNLTANINSTTANAGNLSVANSITTGFFHASRTNSTTFRVVKDGVTLVGGAGQSANNGTRSSLKMYLGARNVAAGAQNFVNANYGLAGVGTGFTGVQCTDFYNIVQQYQTILGRQV